jgi:hypothetical protein
MLCCSLHCLFLPFAIVETRYTLKGLNCWYTILDIYCGSLSKRVSKRTFSKDFLHISTSQGENPDVKNVFLPLLMAQWECTIHAGAMTWVVSDKSLK